VGTVGFLAIVDHSAVGGVLKVLKILMFAMNGEKDFSKDNIRTKSSC
tara:strand:- start:225 stop:365 length:141 start_codon:yes stop_codon:yes gene_type:complete